MIVDLAKRPGSATDLAPTMDLALKDLEDEVLERWEKAIKKHKDSLSEDQDLLGFQETCRSAGRISRSVIQDLRTRGLHSASRS